MDGQGTKHRRNIAENYNRLSRAHERYRQTTDGRATAYSERELTFTFAKNGKPPVLFISIRRFLMRLLQKTHLTDFSVLVAFHKFRENPVITLFTNPAYGCNES